MTIGRVLKYAAIVIAQLTFLLVGYFILRLVYPDAPGTSPPGDWAWIEAPKVPLLWEHGWWLSCEWNEEQKTDRCTLLTGQSHDLVYSGPYVACQGEQRVPQSELRIVRPIEAKHMWADQSPATRLAPVVLLADNRLMVPTALYSNCKALTESSRDAFPQMYQPKYER